MDGLCNVTGATGDIEIGGVKYRLSVPTAADFGEIERHVVAMRGNPLKELACCLDDFPAENRQMALKAACDSVAGRSPRADADEIGAFAGSPAGIAFMLFIMLRRNHSEIDTPEAANKLLLDLDAATATRMVDVMKQLSAVETAAKNSPSTDEKTETTDPHESRGLESIST